MRHSWSVPVLLAFAALAGYAAGARPVQAQSELSPFSGGDLVMVSLAGGGTRSCAIEEIRGSFARCGTGQRQPLSIGQRERPEEWVNLSEVEWVTRTRPNR
jgi:hypothetical protein